MYTSKLQGGEFGDFSVSQCAYSRAPTPSSENCMWLLMRDLEVNLYRMAPFRRKMHHQSVRRMNVGRNMKME